MALSWELLPSQIKLSWWQGDNKGPIHSLSHSIQFLATRYQTQTGLENRLPMTEFAALKSGHHCVGGGDDGETTAKIP